MPKVIRTRLTVAEVETLGSKLDGLPEKQRPLSAREVLTMLKPKIVSLRQRGYDWDEIATELSRQGVPTTGDTVRAATGSVRKRTPRKKTNGAAERPAHAPRSSAEGSVNPEESRA